MLAAADFNAAASLKILALLYYTQGEHAKAGPLFKRLLPIGGKATDPDCPVLAAILG